MDILFNFITFSGLALSLFLAVVLLRTNSKKNRSARYLVLIFIFFALNEQFLVVTDVKILTKIF